MPMDISLLPIHSYRTHLPVVQAHCRPQRDS